MSATFTTQEMKNNNLAYDRLEFMVLALTSILLNTMQLNAPSFYILHAYIFVIRYILSFYICLCIV